MSSTQHIILVGGGDSYSNQADFWRALRTQPIFDAPTKTSYQSWKNWLVTELGEQWVVDMPQMPNKQNAHYEEWRIWFERHVALAPKEVILIGYSLGAMFLAKYLIENKPTIAIKSLILLAGPCGTYDDGTGNDCGTFRFESTHLSAVAAQTQRIIIMHSEDDPVVPYEHALQYKAALPQAELMTFSDKNHFLIEEFPELLALVRELG